MTFAPTGFEWDLYTPIEPTGYRWERYNVATSYTDAESVGSYSVIIPFNGGYYGGGGVAWSFNASTGLYTLINPVLLISTAFYEGQVLPAGVLIGGSPGLTIPIVYVANANAVVHKNTAAAQFEISNIAEKLFANPVYSRGTTYYGAIDSPTQNYYPSNGIGTGNYWYVYISANLVHTKGAATGTSIKSPVVGTYPANGYHAGLDKWCVRRP